MNKQLLFIALLAFSTLNAQTKMTEKEAAKHMKEVQKSKDKGTSIWDWDTVYNNGIPYCIIYEVEKGAFHHNDYSVRSLTGQELIYVKYDTYIDYSVPHQPNTPPSQSGYYQYIFTDTKQVAELLMNRPFKEIVRNSLIDNGTTINSAAETAFLALYPRKYSQMVPPPVAPPPPMVIDYTPVPRNRNGGLMILLNSILARMVLLLAIFKPMSRILTGL